MANAIALFKKYIDLLDDVYKAASCSSVLDMDGSLVQAGANANEIIIPKISMDGLADYSRNGGYVQGNVEITNETVKFNYDRGRKFSVDAMDNEETAGLAFGKLASEFIRTKAVPEMDAVRFASYAAINGIGSKAETISGAEAFMDSVREGVNVLDEAEVPADGRYLFVTPTLYNAAQSLYSYISKSVLEGFAGIIKVHQSRFWTAVSLLNGTSSGEEIGGFKRAEAVYEVTTAQPDDWSTNYKDYYTVSDGVYSPVTGGNAPSWSAGKYYKKTSEGGAPINFMIVHKPAVIQFGKHTVSKVISPDANPDADAYIFSYRAYGLTDAYENKAAGIYCSHAEV